MPSLERDLNDTRGYYESGKTKEASWRESQLKGLRRFLIEKQEDIMNALMHDLGKHQLEAFRDEVSLPILISSAIILYYNKKCFSMANELKEFLTQSSLLSILAVL